MIIKKPNGITIDLSKIILSNGEYIEIEKKEKKPKKK